MTLETDEQPDDHDDRRLLTCAILELIAPEELDGDALAAALATRASPTSIADVLERVAHLRLAELPSAGDRGFLTTAGRQYLEAGGRVPHAAVAFAPFVGDLYAREALRQASISLFDDLLYDVAHDHDVVIHSIVPPPFHDAIDAELAPRFLGAIAALAVRFAAGEPAACAAEEIVTVALIERATNALTQAARDDSIDALRDIYEFYEDDEVLGLWNGAFDDDPQPELDLTNPADLSIAIQEKRLEAWFVPYPGDISAGHLGGPLQSDYLEQ